MQIYCTEKVVWRGTSRLIRYGLLVVWMRGRDNHRFIMIHESIAKYPAVSYGTFSHICEG